MLFGNVFLSALCVLCESAAGTRAAGTVKLTVNFSESAGVTEE
jgi:hypothetical protein